MTTALITGITGQDGSYLAELLLGKGYRVVGTSRKTGPPTPAGTAIEIRALDLEHAPSVERLFAELGPDQVYHLAGQSSVGLSFAEPALTFRSIALTTLNVLEASRRAARPPRVFIAGSGEVFGDTGTARANEGTPLAPASPYALSKAAAVELARSYRRYHGVFAAIGFLYNHESPRRPERFVTRKIVRAACDIARGAADRLVLGDLRVVRDWGWAPEYVEAMWRMLGLDAPEDFVIATGQSHPLGEFVKLVFDELDLTAEDYVTSDPKLFRPGEVRALHADPSHALKRLGWQASVSLGELAHRMVVAEQAALERENQRSSA